MSEVPLSPPRFVVDRREGEYVVVQTEGGAGLDLPGWLLPPEVREGDVVIARAASAEDGWWRVELRVDAEATLRARRAASARLARLKANDPDGDVSR